jgi:hypothetical protein
MTLIPLDIDAIRGKRNLKLTMNGETWDVGIREADFLPVTGVMRTSADGEVISDLIFWDGQLEIAHNDVVVRNCYFRNRGFHTVYQLGGASNALIDLCTFDGRPDNAVVNASNSDFTFAHNRPMRIDRSIFLDASNDSLNFVGGKCERSIIIGGGFTAGAHADAISVHTTVAEFMARQMYIDYRQRPGAVIPNACIKYVSVPSIGQGQGAGNGIAHEVSVYDSVLIGGGYTCYLDTEHSVVTNCLVDMGYWYGESDVGDVYPPVPAGFEDNYNAKDVDDDFVSIAVGDGEELPGGGTDPDPDGTEEEIAALWDAIALLTESQKADHDRIAELTENLHKA